VIGRTFVKAFVESYGGGKPPIRRAATAAAMAGMGAATVTYKFLRR